MMTHAPHNTQPCSIDMPSCLLKYANRFVYKQFVGHTFTFATFDCLAVSNWPPGHPRSDHHVSNLHRPDYY